MESSLIVLPLPVFYLLFFRHFRQRFDFLKHLETIFLGATFALVLSLGKNYIFSMMPFIFNGDHPVVLSFIQAAFLEKAGAYLFLIIIFRFYRLERVAEGIGLAMLFGLGFSFAENFMYAQKFGNAVILYRTLLAIPLHVATCGMIGFFLAVRTLSRTKLKRITSLVSALILPLFFHGMYDLLIAYGGQASYLIGPYMILLCFLIEAISAYAQIIPSVTEMRIEQYHYEDFVILNRQPSYDRWIRASSGANKIASAPFIRISLSKIQMILAPLFIIVVVINFVNLDNYFQVSSGILKRQELVSVAILYPLSLFIVILLTGSVNPLHFKESLLRIPVVLHLAIFHGGRLVQKLETYSFSLFGYYVHSVDIPKFHDGTEVRISFADSEPVTLKAEVTWSNASEDACIMNSSNSSLKFFRFYLRFQYFRFVMGVAYNLRMPGFQAIRKYFLHPTSLLQENKNYSRDHLFFREGDPGSVFYFLRKGRIDFFKRDTEGKDEFVGSAGPGEVFGEMALLGEDLRAATALAATDVVVSESDTDNLKALLEHSPDFALHLIRKVIERGKNSDRLLKGNLSKAGILNEIYLRFCLLTVYDFFISLHPDKKKQSFEKFLSAFREVLGYSSAEIKHVAATIFDMNDFSEEEKALYMGELFTSFHSLLRKFDKRPT